jgi:hypothetical protein
MDAPVFSFSLWTLAYAQVCEYVEVGHDDDVSACGKGSDTSFFLVRKILI